MISFPRGYELPIRKRIRFRCMYGLPEQQIETLTSSLPLANFFEDVVWSCAGEEKGVEKALEQWYGERPGGY